MPLKNHHNSRVAKLCMLAAVVVVHGSDTASFRGMVNPWRVCLAQSRVAIVGSVAVMHFLTLGGG